MRPPPQGLNTSVISGFGGNMYGGGYDDIIVDDRRDDLNMSIRSGYQGLDNSRMLDTSLMR